LSAFDYWRSNLVLVGTVFEATNLSASYFYEEVRKLMLDREAWRSRIKMIVAANKEVDSIKEKIEKLVALKLEVPLLLFIV
jgi:hypothetical protein